MKTKEWPTWLIVTNAIILSSIFVTIAIIGGNRGAERDHIRRTIRDCETTFMRETVPELVNCREAGYRSCTMDAREYGRFTNARLTSESQCAQ